MDKKDGKQTGVVRTLRPKKTAISSIKKRSARQQNPQATVRSVPARVANRPDAGEPSKARCSQPPTTRCQSPQPRRQEARLVSARAKNTSPTTEKSEENQIKNLTISPSSSPLLPPLVASCDSEAAGLRPHRVINPSPPHPRPGTYPPPFQSPNPPGAQAPNPPSHLLVRELQLPLVRSVSEGAVGSRGLRVFRSGLLPCASGGADLGERAS